MKSSVKCRVPGVVCFFVWADKTNRGTWTGRSSVIWNKTSRYLYIHIRLFVCAPSKVEVEYASFFPQRLL